MRERAKGWCYEICVPFQKGENLLRDDDLIESAGHRPRLHISLLRRNIDSLAACSPKPLTFRNLKKASYMRKVTHSYKEDHKYKLGVTSDSPISPSSVSYLLDTPFCEAIYGHIEDNILSLINYPATDEDGFSFSKDVDVAALTDEMQKINKPVKRSHRTTKEIADSLLEKEGLKKEKRYYIKKLIENNKLKYAKKLAMKARRREFASQRARLVLIMIESGQDYLCSKCGSEDNLTVDHIYPLSRGGTDDPSNLAFLCQSCNSAKGSKIE